MDKKTIEITLYCMIVLAVSVIILSITPTGIRSTKVECLQTGFCNDCNIPTYQVACWEIYTINTYIGYGYNDGFDLIKSGWVPQNQSLYRLLNMPEKEQENYRKMSEWDQCVINCNKIYDDFEFGRCVERCDWDYIGGFGDERN